jgi:hypothetical protein
MEIDLFAVAATLFHRASMRGKVGQQMQTWARCPEGWRARKAPRRAGPAPGAPPSAV